MRKRLNLESGHNGKAEKNIGGNIGCANKSYESRKHKLLVVFINCILQ